MPKKAYIVYLVLFCCFYCIGGTQSSLFHRENSCEFKISQHPYGSADSPIDIDDNVALDSYCSVGDGLSWETAFIIQNLVIDSLLSNGIFIQNTDAFLIIRNCTVYNAGATISNGGIHLYQCKNVLISNCTAFENNYYGIILTRCESIEVQDCTFYDNFDAGVRIGDYTNHSRVVDSRFWDNKYGIVCYPQSSSLKPRNNTIFGNLVQYHSSFGIRVSESLNTTVEQNAIYHNKNSGVWGQSLEGTIIQNNTLINNTDGIFLDVAPWTTIAGNQILNNTARGINLGFGFFGLCHNSQIMDNTVLNNSLDQLYLQSSNNVNISSNRFEGAKNIASIDYQGIYLSGVCDELTICNNSIKFNQVGIHFGLDKSCYALIANNTLSNNLFGVRSTISFQGDQCGGLWYSNITGNQFISPGNFKFFGCWSNLSYNYFSEGSLRLESCGNNTIYCNIFMNGTYGIELVNSNNNTIQYNSLNSHNQLGISLSNAQSNLILNNTVKYGNYRSLDLAQSHYNEILGNIFYRSNLGPICLTDSNSNIVKWNILVHAYEYIYNINGWGNILAPNLETNDWEFPNDENENENPNDPPPPSDDSDNDEESNRIQKNETEEEQIDGYIVGPFLVLNLIGFLIIGKKNSRNKVLDKFNNMIRG